MRIYIRPGCVRKTSDRNSRPSKWYGNIFFSPTMIFAYYSKPNFSRKMNFCTSIRESTNLFYVIFTLRPCYLHITQSKISKERGKITNFCGKKRCQSILRYLYVETLKHWGKISLHKLSMPCMAN